MSKLLLRLALFILRRQCIKMPYCNNCPLYDEDAEFCILYDAPVQDFYLPEREGK